MTTKFERPGPSDPERSKRVEARIAANGGLLTDYQVKEGRIIGIGALFEQIAVTRTGEFVLESEDGLLYLARRLH